MDYQKLFEYMADEHGVTLLESDMQEIHKIVLESESEQCNIEGVSVSVLSDEEMREPIENALYATRRFLTTQAADLAEGIIQYIKDAGYIIVRTER